MVSHDSGLPSDHIKAVPVVQGAEVVLHEPVDEAFGVPAEAARTVAEQILGALATHNIDPDTVVFSGYYNADDWHRKLDAESTPHGEEFSDQIERVKQVLPGLQDDSEPDNYIALAVLARRANLLPRVHRRPYFFNSADQLADGETGPLAFAATGPSPAVGVYDLDALDTLGYIRVLQAVHAAPEQVEGALVLEFRPTYRHTDPEA